MLGPKKPKEPKGLDTKTDAELQNALDAIAKYPSDKRKGFGGAALGTLEKAIKGELDRRRLAKPPETPAVPDTTQAASNAMKVAQDAAARQRKRAAAGNAGIVRPLAGAGRQTGVQTMVSPTTLLGG